MKTYHEMTESVLQKADKEILKKERRRRNGVCIAASGLCLALLLTVLGMGVEQPPVVSPTLPVDQPGLSVDATDAPQPTEKAKVKITYLSNIEGQTTQETVSSGVSFPLNAMIRVRDVRGLSEEAVNTALQEEQTIVDEFRMPGEGGYGRWVNESVIISIVRNGSITLDFSDCSPVKPVKDVKIETTRTGNVRIGGRLSAMPPEGTTAVPYWPYMLEAYLGWQISSELAQSIREDPTIPLESIRDTVTVTIYYENGATETLIFDITVNEEGQIFVTQRGIPTEVA